MRLPPHAVPLAVLGIALLAANPRSGPLEFVHRGNEAFAGGDFAAAVDLYTAAEDTISDPGLVAFNKGAAFYHLGQYREAELHYRRCLENPEGSRLARLLYSLANCLVQQAPNDEPDRLREAISLYRRCLQEEGADPTLLADARHNLELAQLLLLRTKSNKEGSNREQPQGSDESPLYNQSDGAKGPASLNGRNRGGRRGQGLDARAGTDGMVARDDQLHSPGTGNLPPIPDEDNLATLSPEDAAEHLRQQALRIERERKDHQLRNVPLGFPSWKDW
jgi:tetratricopeptide (TPR) repeat protein